MTYGDFKDLTRTTASDKILLYKIFNIAKNSKYGYQRGPASMVYKFYDKETSGSAATLAWSETLATRATRNKSTIKNENMLNKELAQESHKPIVRKFKKKKSMLVFYR